MDGIALVGDEENQDLSAIAALHPDLILGHRPRQEKLYPALSAIAPTVFSDMTTAGWRPARAVGYIFGEELSPLPGELLMQPLVFTLRVGVSAAVLIMMTGFSSVACSQTGTAPPPSSESGKMADSARKPEETDPLLGPKVMVEWLLPALPTYSLPTDKDRAVFYVSGREEPTREILQPPLDPALPAYQPRTDLRLSGNFKGRTRETFPRQVKLWIEAFKKYYPNVNIDVSPPYGGEVGAKQIIKGEVDFVLITRELKHDDYTDFKAAFGEDPLVVPVCGGSWRHVGFTDAEVFFVNKDNPLEKISFDQLDAIFSSTHHRGGKPITTWGQLGLTGVALHAQGRGSFHAEWHKL